jgi:hypothetical protein
VPVRRGSTTSHDLGLRIHPARRSGGPLSATRSTAQVRSGASGAHCGGVLGDRRRMKRLVCACVLTLGVSACGSATRSSATTTAPLVTRSASEVIRHEQVVRNEELFDFVRTMRSKLAEDFVAAEGQTGDSGGLTGLNVILLDRVASHHREQEVRRLFAAMAPTISPRLLRVVFAPVTEKVLLAAYERFTRDLANGGHLSSLNDAGVERSSGSLVVHLDPDNKRYTRDAGTIRAIAASFAPVTVRIETSSPSRIPLHPG